MTSKPILITGSHRSGSTWVGKTIAHSPNIGYIHEPFNLLCRPGSCNTQFSRWFTHIPVEDKSNTYLAIRDTLNFKYGIGAELKACESFKDFLRMVRDARQTTGYRVAKVRPLMKDPIAIFSAEWLFNKFDMDIVVLIRHPAAFVSSLKIKDWTFPFEHLLQQDALMDTFLQPFASDIEEYSNIEHDILDQAILLWKLVHHVILQYQQNHPEWLYIRHEDISRDPVHSFQSIFKYLDLEFVPSVAEAVTNSTSASNPKETSSNIHFVKRNSALNIWNWQKRLSPSEIERIHSGVQDIAEAFYTSEDWQADTSHLAKHPV